MPGVNTWFERFLDADRVLVMLFSWDPLDYRTGKGAWDGLRDIAFDKETKPFVSIEDITLPNPDKSRWDELCGRWELPKEDPRIGGEARSLELFRKDGDLYVRFLNRKGEPAEKKYFPVGPNTFGLLWTDDEIVFENGSLTVNGQPCRKHQ